MKIYEDSLVANATPSRKMVSFGSFDRNAGRTPLRDHNHKSPHAKGSSKGKTLQSPSGKTVSSNAFRQGLKKGCTPLAKKTLSAEGTENNTPFFTSMKEANIEQRTMKQLSIKIPPKTPSSASAMRRTLRSTAQPTQQLPRQESSKQESLQPQRLPLRPPITFGSTSHQPFQSLTTAMTSTSLNTRPSIVGRSKLLGKGGPVPGKSSLGALGPPTRVAPKTPNTLLRTELEDDDDDFDESMLLSPPPGAVWDALNLSSGGDKHQNISPTVTTGLIVVSPQAAEQIHTWSSTKKNLSKADENDRPSPPVPRALMQTPHAVRSETDGLLSEAGRVPNQPSNPKSSTPKERIPTMDQPGRELPSVQKSTKGGIAMDFTNKLSLDNRRDQDTKQEGKRVRDTPLSSSIPPAVLARLNSKRQTNTQNRGTTNEKSKTSTAVLKGSSKSRAQSRALKPKNRQPKDATNDRKTGRTTIEKPWKPKRMESDATNSSSNAMTRRVVKERKNNQSTISKTKSSRAMQNSNAEMKKLWKELEPKPFSRRDTQNDDSNPEKTSSAQEDSITPKSRRGGIAFEIELDDSDAKARKFPVKNRLKKSAKTNPPSTTKQHIPNESWADKQSQIFVGWLNYTINPEEMDYTDKECGASGLRALIIHRRLAEGRVNAINLNKSDCMRQIRTNIVREITKGKLSIRSDRDVASDVQLRKVLTSLFLSYSSPWLRVALEVMYGEYIEPVPFNESNPKSYLYRMKQSLESFIRKRFLSDEPTLHKYTGGRCSVPSGKFERQYKAEMRNLILSRMLTLVFLLDRAKEANVLDNVPRLFTISSNVKSTRDVLVKISRECLHAEGDVVKHLSRIGLKISYVQDPVDEVNFKISNLATDLRDGIILTRLAEILTGTSFKSLMHSLRMPVVSRLQKKFNVNLAFSAIKDHGIIVAEGINAHHIMDGHKEMVLAFMWCIIAHCCMEKIIKADQVEQEIQNVIRSSKARKKVQGRLYSSPKNAGITHAGFSPNDGDVTVDKTLKDLLLRWSGAVCSSFGMQVNDLSNSFADGRVLCLLIHYYHPSLIRMDEIYPGDLDANMSLEEVTENEHRNWRKSALSMQKLGGIPDMLPVCDTSNPPSEESMILCLSYLCSRLMESSQEIFASILIQACYRNYSRKKLMEKKMKASSVIFRIWTEYKENYYRKQKQQYKIAVATLEDFVLTHKQALRRLRKIRLQKEHKTQAALEIQRIFRGRVGRVRAKEKWKEHQASILIQSTFRGYRARNIFIDLGERRKSAVTIQNAFRGFVARETFLCTIYQTIELQRIIRGYLTRKELQTQEYAALVIQQAWWSYVAVVESEMAAILVQKVWRGVLGRSKFIELWERRDAACSMQTVWRRYYQTKMYQITRESVIVMQSLARGYITRKVVPIATYRDAATSIQKAWRGFSVQVQFQIELLDIVCIQSLARRYLARRAYVARVNALSTLQCAFRCSIARTTMFLRIRDMEEEQLRQHSAVIIQAYLRRFLATREVDIHHYCAFLIQKQWRKFMRHRVAMTSSTLIQTVYRSWKCRNSFVMTRKAVVDMQRLWRGFASRQNDQLLSFAATQIQSAWRCYWVYSDYIMYIKEKKAAILIQALIRGKIAREMIVTYHFSALTIQVQWQRYKEYKLSTFAATRIQAAYRSKRLRSQYRSLMQATIVLQGVVRCLKAKKIVHLKQKERQFEEAATSIQKVWRGFSQQVKYQMDVFDIICVQNLFRRRLASKAYQRHRLAAAAIQRGFRCAAARQERFMRKLVLDTLVMESSTLIQAIIRGYFMRTRYRHQKFASMDIQRYWRGFKTREHIQELSESSIVIQNVWRMYQARSNLEAISQATTIIQNLFRCYIQYSKFRAMKEVAFHLQRSWRGKTTRRHITKLSQAATKIQTHWRRSLVQNNYLLDLLEIKSATLIQASFRMYVRRLDYMVVKYSAHTIQRFTRGLLTRVDIAVKHFAASEIQRTWRGYCTLPSKTIISSLIKMQSVVRMGFAKKKVAEKKLLYWVEICNKNRNAAVIQCAFRVYKHRRRRNFAAATIQQFYLFHSERKRIQKASQGLIRFQSRLRGAWVRSNRCKRLAELSYRIQLENRRAMRNPTLRLGYRTSRALEILQTSQSLTKIMDAVKELEASTRLSIVCCQVFTKVNAAGILLHLIQSCNRSVPHMELKEHILLTLENVAQYSSLVRTFAHYKYAEVFLDNVQVFRDKDGIFCLAVILLDRIAKANEDVAQFCATHEHLKRLKEVYRVVSSKRITSRRNRVVSERVKRLRVIGLAKKDYFDRAESTKLLGNMIDTFSKIEVRRVTTPTSAKVFNFE